MERIEDLQLNGLKIIRNEDLPGYTTDSVLLAEFVRTKPGVSICDLGTGTGIIPLLLIGRQPNINITGIEIHNELAELAKKSVKLNELEEYIHIILGDIRQIDQFAPPKSFDVVVCNPPYFTENVGGINTHQHTCNEEDVIKAAVHLLLPRGYFYACCPANRLLVIADAMRKHNVAPKFIRFIASRQDKAPYLVLIQGRLGAKAGYVTLPQLILLDSSNQYTDEMNKIYHIKNEEKP